MTAALRGGDPDVADLARLFHLEEHWKMLLPVDDIVNLHQVETTDVPVPTGFLDLVASVGAERGPDLVGGENPGRSAQLPQAISNDIL